MQDVKGRYRVSSRERLLPATLTTNGSYNRYSSPAYLTSSRLKSDFRYSGTLVYNTYPFPPAPTDAQRQAVTDAVLAARAAFHGESLAALYDPTTMPPALARAHQALDRAVDHCYRPQPFRLRAGPPRIPLRPLPAAQCARARRCSQSQGQAPPGVKAAPPATWAGAAASARAGQRAPG